MSTKYELIMLVCRQNKREWGYKGHGKTEENGNGFAK
jgi:hypothetical protein